MKTNKKLFIGLLVMSAFFGACLSMPVKVKNIPPSWFEDNRGEGERLVYVTVEGPLGDHGVAGTNLFIATDNAAIQNLTAPFTRVAKMGLSPSPSVQNSIRIPNRGLAVFSLPKSQDTIGFAYFCDSPFTTEDAALGGAVSVTSEIIYSNGRGACKIDPNDGDIAIRVIVKPSDDEAFKAATSGSDLRQSPSGDGTFRALTTTSASAIQQMISECNQYGTPSGTGSPGFIAAPVKEK